MLSNANYKLLKPVFFLNNVIILLFFIFFLIPFVWEKNTEKEWWMWLLWTVSLLWDAAIMFWFPFSQRFRDRLTSAIPTFMIFAITAALTLLFLHLV